MKTSGVIVLLIALPLLALPTPAAQAREAADPCAAPTIVGTDNPDRIDGTPGPDVIDGGPGNDAIRGAGGDDILLSLIHI